MLIELYNELKEQDRFSDVFKPISKEEKEVRLKKRLEASEYNYAHTADVVGFAAIVGGLEIADLNEEEFSDIISTIVGRTETEVAELEILLIELKDGYDNEGDARIGKFEGRVVLLSEDRFDEKRLIQYFGEIIGETSSGDGMFPNTVYIYDVIVSNLEVIERV